MDSPPGNGWPGRRRRKRRRPWRRLKGSFKGPFKGGDHDGQIMMDVLQRYNAQDDDGGAAPQLRWGAIHADAPLFPGLREARPLKVQEAIALQGS